MTNVAIAFGGNIGNAELIFNQAINLLNENGFLVGKKSTLMRNLPVGCIDGTPDFFNGAIIGKWKKDAITLLLLTQKIETTLGRPKKHQSNMARTIDLDIILFGDQIIKSEDLIIPHPRAQDRIFVISPLNDIAPDWMFPDTKLSVSEVFRKIL